MSSTWLSTTWRTSSGAAMTLPSVLLVLSVRAVLAVRQALRVPCGRAGSMLGRASLGQMSPPVFGYRSCPDLVSGPHDSQHNSLAGHDTRFVRRSPVRSTVLAHAHRGLNRATLADSSP